MCAPAAVGVGVGGSYNRWWCLGNKRGGEGVAGEELVL